MEKRKEFMKIVERVLNEEINSYVAYDGAYDLDHIATCLSVISALKTIEQADAQTEISNQISEAVKNMDLSKFDVSSMEKMMAAVNGNG